MELKGAIFDLDDTLLDNFPKDGTGLGLHERSRLQAVHEVGEACGVKQLVELTSEENFAAFKTAAIHSMHGAVWSIFFMKGLAPSNEPNSVDNLIPLAEKIVARKDEVHEEVIRRYGAEIVGASKFIRALAAAGLAKHLALASGAIERDINIFLDKYRLNEFFPDSRIICHGRTSRTKPDPEPFDLAFKTLGLPEADRANVLAFEDDPKGVRSAKAAGLLCCAITTRLNRNDDLWRADPPDMLVDSYQEAGRLLGLPDY